MIEIDAQKFHERLTFVSRGAMNRFNEMYRMVCLEQNEAGIFLRSFNEVSHTLSRIATDGGDPMQVLFNPSPLLGAISRVEGPLTIDLDAQGLVIEGPVSLRHPCANGNNFIAFPRQEVDPVALKSGESLSNAVKQAESAVDPDNPNSRFAGVYMGDRHSPGSVRCVGCNTTSLVEVVMADAKDADKFEGESILPARALQQVRRVLESGDEVNLYLGEREASFVTETQAVCARLLADKYPNYPAILPGRDDCQEIRVNAEGLEKALRICQEYTEEYATVFLDFEGDTLTVSGGEASGYASYEVATEAEGEIGLLRLKMSATRLLEVIRPMQGRTLGVYVPIEEEPTRIRVEGDAEGIWGAVALMRPQPNQ